MRQAYEPIPWLGAGPAPQVVSCTGVGRTGGGGAEVQTADGTGFGHIEVTMGFGAATSGQVIIRFSTAPPILFFAPDEMFGPLTVLNNDGAHTDITIQWTRPGGYIPRNRYRIHYEWSVSK